MKGRIILDSMAHEFRLLRNRLEAEIKAPALIVITSATDHDGAALTAFGITESLSKTKQRVVLVTTDGLPNSTSEMSISSSGGALRRRASDRLEEQNLSGHFAVVNVSPERLSTISRSSVDSLVADLRSKYDYVVIDAGNLPKNTFGLLLVASAEATLIAFRAGRSQVPSDRVMLDTLERAEAKILGVVMTDQASIEHFNPSEESVAFQEPIMARRRFGGIAKRLEVAIGRIGKST